MPSNIRPPGDPHGCVTRYILELENRLANLQYLLARPDITDAQRQRLQRFLQETEAELASVYDLFDDFGRHHGAA